MNIIRDLLYFMGVGGNTQPYTALEEKMSLLRVLGDNTTTSTKGGRLARIIELRGKDYSGMESAVVNALYIGRKQFFDTLPSTIIAFPQSHRVRIQRTAGSETFANPMSARIAEKWAENFNITYRTRHFLVLSTNIESIMDKIGVMAEGGGHDEVYRLLDECCQDTLIQLKEYSPRLLSGDEVSSYWAWLIESQHQHVRLNNGGFLDDAIIGADVKFPKGKRHMVYEGEKTRYSAMLHISSPNATTDPRFFDGLFRLHREFSIWQNYTRLDKTDALSDVDDRLRNTLSFRAAGDVIIAELQELAQRLQADEISSLIVRWSIEIYAESLEELEKAVREVRGVIQTQGYKVKQEGKNLEAQFWSRFPEFDSRRPGGPPNPRKRGLTSENAAHFVNFSSAGEGLDSCSWGNAPVMQFKTPQGSEFSFTFHGSPAPKWPGHTLLIGGNNSGKTTLASMLLSQCSKYPGFRALLLDRLHGLEVCTRMHGGTYLDVIDGLEINPLMLPDDMETRAFLSNWFQSLTGKTDDDASDAINAGIRATFALSRDERTLDNIADAFGLVQEGSIRAALKPWLAGGQYEGLFTSKRDALDFDKQYVGIDMTTLLDSPDVLGPLALYMFHKLLVLARDRGGYALFVDELPRYLKNPVMSEKIDIALQEFRKTDGIFIGAAQSIDSILNSPSIDKFLTNIETYILFPEPRARRAHYSQDADGLRLNDQEFMWLTQTHRPREALIKRKSGESTIISTDLSSIGELLHVFNSSSDAVVELNQLRRERDDWQEAYLRSRH